MPSRFSKWPRTGISGTEKGSALVYILIAIALLAALTISFMQPASQQTQSQNSFKLTADLSSQVEFIRTNIQECAVVYSKGDSGIGNGSETSPPAIPPLTDLGANKNFPVKPTSTRLINPVTPVNAPNLVKDLRCPGNPGDDPNHTPIFNGSSGKFMPPPPALFGDWQYYNGLDGVFYWIASDKTDAYILSALQKLNAQFGVCEADVIDASTSAKDLDNAGTISCPLKSTCFRMWMISHKADVAPVTKKSKFPDEPSCP
ncbi:MAG: hypothetical protein JWO78_1144 [Micavibrio sp.]|nr:hypothetical protein [Micavibrio sp.]